MSILDQLKAEATLKQESEFAQINEQQQLDNIYQATILPRMQKTFTFLKEIVEHLAYLEKGVEIADYSEKYPQIGALVQKDYQISTDGYGGLADFDRIMQVNVLFICEGRGFFKYELEGRGRIEREVAFLHSKNVPFDWNQFVNSAGVEAASFSITRKIPVRFKFEVDFENSNIKLLINNHIDFSVYSKVFEPEEVDEQLLDEVIRFMLRKDSDFIRLDIDNMDKQLLQKKAEEAQMQQAKWLEEIQVEEEKEREVQEENDSKFFSRIKSPFGKRKK
ncbi:MAG: hypothetical protein GQ569_05770 [Methylococcaceae bacterium]|nr:hypothetical protein [Methylococcaceae bacterium]